MSSKLPKFLDFENYPPVLNASLAVENEPDTLFWVRLPVLLMHRAFSIFFEQEPEIASRFDEVLDDTGKFCPAQLNGFIQKFVIERIERTVQAARLKNSDTALDLINYAAKEDSPPDAIERLLPEMKVVASMGYAHAERDDAQQAAALCLLEHLDSLRKSREKLFQAFFGGTLNYVFPMVRNKLIDEYRTDHAQKRAPAGLESLDQGLEPFGGDSHRYKDKSESIEEYTIAKDLVTKLLRVIDENFPNEPRLQQIVKMRLENEGLSSADLADRLGCSKKTIDRDLAKLRKNQPIIDFVEQHCPRQF